MLYVVFYSIFVFFGTLSTVFATDAGSVPLSPSTEELIAKGICVHATKVMPRINKSGQMMIVPKALTINDLEDPPATLEHEIARSNRCFNDRPTIHFSYGGLAEGHSGSGKISDLGWSPPDYIILEPYRNLAESMYGGSIEDLFIFGPHMVSAEARILVPQSELAKWQKESDGKYVAQFRGYNPKKKKHDIVGTHIKEMGGWDIRVDQEAVFFNNGKPVRMKKAVTSGLIGGMATSEGKYSDLLNFRPDRIRRNGEDDKFSIIMNEISINGKKELRGKKYYTNIFIKNLLQGQQLFRGNYDRSLISSIDINSQLLFGPFTAANIYFDKEQEYKGTKLIELKQLLKNLTHDNLGKFPVARLDHFVEIEAKRQGVTPDKITNEYKNTMTQAMKEHPATFLSGFILAQFNTLEADLKDRSQSARDYFAQWKSEFMNWLFVLGFKPGETDPLRQKIYYQVFRHDFYEYPKKLKNLFTFMDQANQLIETELKKRTSVVVPQALSIPAALDFVPPEDPLVTLSSGDSSNKMIEDKNKDKKKKKKKKKKAKAVLESENQQH